MGSKKIHVISGWSQSFGILQDQRVSLIHRLHLFYVGFSWLEKGCWHTTKEIGELLKASPDSVKRTRSLLVKQGLLEVVTIKGEDGEARSPKRGRGRAYRACGHDLDDRGLEILQRMQPGAVICRPDEREATMAVEMDRRKQRAETLAQPPMIWVPAEAEIEGMDLEMVRGWEALHGYLLQPALSALWDGSDGEGKQRATWESLKHRAAENASSSLSGVSDPDLRLQVLLMGIALVWEQRQRAPIKAADPIRYLAGCLRGHGRDRRDIMPPVGTVVGDLQVLGAAGVPSILGETPAQDSCAGEDEEIDTVVEEILP